jgi:outer membrane lipoprotein carrier protein
MNRFFSALFVVIVGVIFTSPSAFSADKNAAQQLVAALGNFSSLAADFNQRVVDEKGKELQKSTGYMLAAKPDRMIWQIKTPFQYLVITDGKTLWRYDADLEQATRQPYDGELRQTPALVFSADVEKLQERYDIRLQKTDAQGSRFELIPRSGEKLFRSFTLAIRQGNIDELVMTDNIGQTTTVNFTNIQKNPPLKVDQFQFTPPPETDIIDNGQ